MGREAETNPNQPPSVYQGTQDLKQTLQQFTWLSTSFGRAFKNANLLRKRGHKATTFPPNSGSQLYTTLPTWRGGDSLVAFKQMKVVQHMWITLPADATREPSLCLQPGVRAKNNPEGTEIPKPAHPVRRPVLLRSACSHFLLQFSAIVFQLCSAPSPSPGTVGHG